MSEALSTALGNIRSQSGVAGLDEASIRQVVVLQILAALEWNQFDHAEVTPEFVVSGGRVDYSLQIGGQSKVFIEVKRGGEALSPHQDQLLRYSFERGVSLAVLTNGLEWWFYLPLREGSWGERRFASLNIASEDRDHIEAVMLSVLSRDSVASGSAVRSAINLLDTLKRESEIREALPKAWRSLIVEQDELLVALIDEKVESLLGFKPGQEPIRRFLDGLSGSIPSDARHKPLIPTSNSTPVQPQSPSRPANARSFMTQTKRSSFQGRKITGFRFQGESFQVSTWNGLLQKLSEIIYGKHQTDFDRVRELRGRHRVYYSFSREDLIAPKRVRKSDYYVETNFNSDATIRQCHKLLRLFEYQDQDLEIDHV